MPFYPLVKGLVGRFGLRHFESGLQMPQAESSYHIFHQWVEQHYPLSFAPFLTWLEEDERPHEERARINRLMPVPGQTRKAG